MLNLVLKRIKISKKYFIIKIIKIAIYFSAKRKQNTQPSLVFCQGFVCAKQNLHKEGVNYLKQASMDSSNAYLHLLLADMLEATDDLNGAEKVYSSVLEQIKAMDDRSLLVEISLARLKCYKSEIKIIDDLLLLEKLLNVADTDATIIHLRVIVYDTLADYYFQLGKLPNAILYADAKSIATKFRCLSNYHISLTTNYLLLAEVCITRHQYREALQYLKTSIDIQYINLADDDINIKLVYYRMGDVYCKMNQLDEALGKYSFAERDDTDEQEEKRIINGTDFEDDRRLTARVRMHQHLAELYAQRSDFDSAIEEQLASIDILKVIYPFDTLVRPTDMRTLVIHLEQLASHTLKLADATALEKSSNPEFIYKKAMSIERDLARFKQSSISNIYRKIGHYYERQQNDKRMAIKYYQEAISESFEVGQHFAIYYALGRLNEDLAEDVQSAAIFFNKANSLVPDNELQVKIITESRYSRNKIALSREQTNDISFNEKLPNFSNRQNDDAENGEVKRSDNEDAPLPSELYDGMFIVHFFQKLTLALVRKCFFIKYNYTILAKGPGLHFATWIYRDFYLKI